MLSLCFNPEKEYSDIESIQEIMQRKQTILSESYDHSIPAELYLER